MTQCERILQFMDQYGSITQADADTLRIKRLASRICELRQRGVNIAVETITARGRLRGIGRCHNEVFENLD